MSTYWLFFPLSLGHWPWFSSQNFQFPIFLESGNWISGNLEILQNWLVWANFNILGIFPTQFTSQNLILNSEFQIFHFSGFFPEIFWKSGNFLEFAFFTDFYVWGIISTWFQSLKLILHSEYPISKLFWIFFWKFSGNLEIFQSLLCLANFNVWGIIST